MSAWNCPTVYIGKEEFNCRIDNVILIEGPKQTGKSWIAFDFINQLKKSETVEEITVILWQDKKIIKDNNVYQDIDFKKYFKDLLEEFKNDSSLKEKELQRIFFIDGFSPDEEYLELFKEIFDEINLSSVTFILTTRDKIVNEISPSAYIQVLNNNYSDKLKIVHQPVLYDNPLEKIIRRQPYDKEHFLFLKEILQ